MDFKIPFSYSVNEIPPRCRKARWVEKNGVANVSVKEKNVSDLKVAFVVKDYKDEIVIYSYNDNLYRIATKRTENGEEKMTIGDLQNRVMAFGRSSFDAKPYAEILTELQERADRFLIVGKTVYEISGEPRYCIYTFGLGHNHGGTSLSVDFHFNENISSERYFDALHYDDAVRMAYDIAMSRGDSDSIGTFRNADYINVVRPECVKCNPKTHGQGNAILQKLEQIIEGCSSKEEAALMVMANASI